MRFDMDGLKVGSSTKVTKYENGVMMDEKRYSGMFYSL